MFILCILGYICFCCCINILFINCKIGIPYKRIPKKYVGKQTPIYKIVQMEEQLKRCNVIKYELLYVEKTNDSLFIGLLLPFPIKYSTLEYVKVYEATGVELYVDYFNSIEKHSYDKLVDMCEFSLLSHKNSQMEISNEKKSMDDLNKIFNDNFVE